MTAPNLPAETPATGALRLTADQRGPGLFSATISFNNYSEEIHPRSEPGRKSLQVADMNSFAK
jgi:hypothetical protein